ncbi:hypothetical protein Leryth_008172 [Lithospermum erythrorhizon]|nr:hypothetical protein Leryth_008172 [Lithospermum erythrorhizon]
MEWQNEKKRGFRTSDLAHQCDYRYKIYVEGKSWSVSEKYILGCDSMTLIIAPQFYDFFTRSLIPTLHYWPIGHKDKCNAIKFAVDWGNQNPNKAQDIGKAASKFIKEQLRMKFVYDYMFHLLNEYAKLLKYEPTIPDDAVEVCSDNMLCGARGVRKSFRIDSRVNGPANESACLLSPPFDQTTLQTFLMVKEKLIKEVEMMRQSS